MAYLAFGIHNGQTANKNEGNDQPHIVARFSYPFKLGKQYIEPGIQGYSGRAVITSMTDGVGTVSTDLEYQDRRLAASIVVYPQPFGLQAEYNVGTGPEYNPASNTIEQKKLKRWIHNCLLFFFT